MGSISDMFLRFTALVPKLYEVHNLDTEFSHSSMIPYDVHYYTKAQTMQGLVFAWAVYPFPFTVHRNCLHRAKDFPPIPWFWRNNRRCGTAGDWEQWMSCTGRKIFRHFRDFGGKIVAVARRMTGNSGCPVQGERFSTIFVILAE